MDLMILSVDLHTNGDPTTRTLEIQRPISVLPGRGSALERLSLHDFPEEGTVSQADRQMLKLEAGELAHALKSLGVRVAFAQSGA